MGDKGFAIQVKNLGKIYKLYQQPIDRLKESLHPFGKKYHNDFYAIKNVSFSVKKGETIGIIGKNGSGKSTLLKIITGVLTPTSGEVTVNGRISALLELGSSFNPEYTGMENIYLQGTMMGYSREEMKKRVPGILEFADIGDFVEQPVKVYSSGMFVRLAFAVAINVDPDILIVDEALAVGDMNFQAKCMTAFTRLQAKGVTVLFVSHDIGSVKSLCSQAVYLENGVMKAVGEAAEIAELYVRTIREEMNLEHQRFLRVSSQLIAAEDSKEKAVVVSGDQFKTSEEFDRRVAPFRYGSGGARITYVELLDMADNPINSVEFNQKVRIRVYLEIQTAKNISVNFNIVDDKKISIAGGNFSLVDQPLLKAMPEERYIVDYCLSLPLQDGNYAIRAIISEPIVANQQAEFIDIIEDAVVFQMNMRETAKLWAKVHLFPCLTVTEVKKC